MGKFFKSKRQMFFWLLVQMPVWILVCILPSHCFQNEQEDVYKVPVSGKFQLFELSGDGTSPVGKIDVKRGDNVIFVDVQGEQFQVHDIIGNVYTFGPVNEKNLKMELKTQPWGEEFFLAKKDGLYYFLANVQENNFLNIGNEKIKYATDIYFFGVVTEAGAYPLNSNYTDTQGFFMIPDDETVFGTYFYQDRVKNPEEWGFSVTDQEK